MSLKIYDSATHKLREFEPITPGVVGIYLCGATVQGSPHIGHIRSALAFDVLVRWMRRSGYQVRMIRNVTDIDDKILMKSQEARTPWWEWAYRFEQEFAQAYRTLGILPPTYEPRATGHITDQIELIQRIIDVGHAYVGEPGNVYFDVESLDDYGSLTRQSLEHMVADNSDAEKDKRNPHDFALWKAPKPGEPETAAWDSPWGKGRPGWHIECSAMAGRYLGDTFDIHGGGIDLRFPHHENEQAQSHAAGRGFARYWMHNAWVTIEGEKMSKSLGNSLTVDNIVKSVKPVVLRFALGTVHYRSTVAYSPSTLTEAETVWERLSGFVERAAQIDEVPLHEVASLTPDQMPEEFVAALNDDFNVSGGLAAIHEAVTRGNTALSARDYTQVRQAQLEVRAMLDVLGLDPLNPQWKTTGNNLSEHEALDTLVNSMLAQRAKARADKDWATADAVRDTLAAAGVMVEDSIDGARWHVEAK